MKPTSKLLALCGSLVFAAAANAATLSYTTGLDVWLDASDIDGSNNSTLSEGAAVSTWTNKGTTGVSNAVLGTTGLSGKTAGTLSATGGLGGQAALVIPDARYQFTTQFMDSPNVTMFFVVNQSSATSSANGTIFNDYGAASNQLILVRTGAAGAYLRSADGAATVMNPDPGDALAIDSWETLHLTVDVTAGVGNATSAWGVLGATASASNALYDVTNTWQGGTELPTLFGFHDGNSTHDFGGMVSEVLIYDHVLTPAQTADVASYLTAKAIPEPSSAALLGLAALALVRRRRA
jgi:hypothetical protein